MAWTRRYAVWTGIGCIGLMVAGIAGPEAVSPR